jgi:hypothetical protein
MSTTDFLKTLTHPVLKALTRKLNLHTSIKGYTTLSRDDLITKLSEKTKYENGKLIVSIPVTELNLPEPKTKKPRKPRATKQVVTEPIAVVESTSDDLTKRMADFIANMNVKEIKQESDKVELKQDIIKESIAEIESIQKDNDMSMTEKKSEMMDILEKANVDMPEIDLSVLSKPDVIVNENLDDGLKDFTKKLFASFYEDELDELDALSFNFGSSDIITEEVSQETPKKVVTAVVNVDTGMISVMEEPEDEELMQAAKMMERERAQRQNIMNPITEEKKPMLKNYIDELNDQLAELDEMSFNFGSSDMIMQMPERMPSPVQMEERIPSPPMIEKPKEKKQIPMQIEQEPIEDPGEWVKANLTPARKFKTPNERFRWMYYPPEEINAISDRGVLIYLKDEAQTFRGLSANHSGKTLQYIDAQINSIQKRQDQLITNRGRGRPIKEETAEFKEEQRQKRITDKYDNLPEDTRNQFYSIIKKIDTQAMTFMREYARFESFEDSYKLFGDDWEDGQVYSDLTDLYTDNMELRELFEDNDITREGFASWVELHINRKNMLAEFNKIIKRAEKVKLADPKLLGREATKIQAGVRGFLTRKRLEKDPLAKSDVVKQKEMTIIDKYNMAIQNGLPSMETLAEYLETPKASVKQILIDINKYIESSKLSKKGQDSLLKKLNKSLIQIRAEKEKELYDIEFNRKEFNAWKELLLKQSYASSGQQAKMYELKKQYKKTDDESKQTQILEKFAQVYNQQKVNKLLTNYNIPF